MSSSMYCCCTCIISSSVGLSHCTTGIGCPTARQEHNARDGCKFDIAAGARRDALTDCDDPFAVGHQAQVICTHARTGSVSMHTDAEDGAAYNLAAHARGRVVA